MDRTELRDKNGMTESEFLAAYRPGDYPHPSVTADILVFALGDRAKLLMIKRGGHPCLGMWALPGGFAEPHENTDATARRELLEETSLDGVALHQLAVFSDPGRDPRGWLITVAYTAYVGEGELNPHAADDADDTAWFDVAYEMSDGVMTITLSSAAATLRAELAIIPREYKYGSERELSIKSCDGIAFDHAKIIATALLSSDYPITGGTL